MGNAGIGQRAKLQFKVFNYHPGAYGKRKTQNSKFDSFCLFFFYLLKQNNEDKRHVEDKLRERKSKIIYYR